MRDDMAGLIAHPRPGLSDLRGPMAGWGCAPDRRMDGRPRPLARLAMALAAGGFPGFPALMDRMGELLAKPYA